MKKESSLLLRNQNVTRNHRICMDEGYKGTLKQIYKYIVKDCGIITENASIGRKPGKYQLGCIKRQLIEIYNSPTKTGRIYYTNEFNTPSDNPKEPSSECFTIQTILVEVLDDDT